MSARYFRTRRGDMVHREGCPSQPPFPIWWNWAEGKTIPEIVSEGVLVGIGFSYCKHCIKAEDFLTGNCEVDCQEACAYPGRFSECDLGAYADNRPDDEDFVAREALGRIHPPGNRAT